MFGLRRRHRKAQPAAAVLPELTSDGKVQLSEEQLFDAVHKRLEEFMGADGTWSLVRRDPEDASHDSIFSSMSTILLAKDIAAELLGATTIVPSHDPADAAPVEAAEPAAVAHDKDLRAMLRPVPRTDDDHQQIRLELTTIATWADPQHHNPAYVDQEMVTPRTAEHDVRGA